MSRSQKQTSISKSTRGGSDLQDLPQAPSFFDSEWLDSISTRVLKSALSRLALEVQPAIMENRARQKALFERLQKRDYTRGEILFAVDRLADDPELDDKLRYGGDLSGADFRRVIEPLRKMRSRLKQGKRLTEDEVWDAIELLPEIDYEDFGTCKPEEVNRRYTLTNEARERLQTHG